MASQSQYEALRSELRETLRSELQETLRSELQAACRLLQTRHGGEGDQGVLLPRSMRLDVPKFEESVKNRFGPSKYENPQGALSKLLQLGTVKEYQREFKKLMNRVTHIPKTLLISFYVSGLKLHIQRNVGVQDHVAMGTLLQLARITESSFETSSSGNMYHN
ncbi:retrotransposon-related protein [Tanacetum coccineum]